MKFTPTASLILAALASLTSPSARADEATLARYKEQVTKAAQEGADKALADLKTLVPADRASPKFGSVGVGLATGVGSSPGSGSNQSLGGTFQMRFYGEGSSGIDLESHSTPNDQTSLVVRDIQTKLRPSGDKNLTLDEQRALQDFTYSTVTEKLKPYTELYTGISNHTLPGLKPSGRPLYVIEGNAQYNMVGHSSGNGTYTGFKGDFKTGLGFSLKDFGKNGCDIYFLAHVEGSGEANYKLENADKASGAVGLEQGPLCQIANAVTIMASPSVQVGGFTHANPYGGPVINSDWLNYAARFRMIVGDRLYTSLEVLHQPSMSNDNTAAKWSSTEFNGTIDAKVLDTWTVGADWRTQQYKDENSGVTGNRSFNDTYVGAHVIRAF